MDAVVQAFSQGASLIKGRAGQSRGELADMRCHVGRQQTDLDAFVEGRPGTPKGTWRQWLELSRDELRQRVVSETQAKTAGSEALEAITHYEVAAEYKLAGTQRVATKLRLRLETGRKHQIRVQAANAGLPLIGDRTYNPEFRRRPPTRARIDFPRQALHAEVLTLEHPDHPGARMSWTAELPKDLRQLESALRSGRAWNVERGT